MSPDPPRPWDPFGVWGQFSGSRPLPGMPGSPPLPGGTPFSPLKPVLNRVVGLIRSRLVGRRVTVRFSQAELRLTLTDLDARLDTFATSAGQLDDVTAAARDVVWGAGPTFEKVTVTLRNIHIRSGTQPTLVTAPVDLVLTLSSEVIAGLVATHRPALVAEITEDAQPRVRWAARPEWAHLWVSLGVNGTRIRVHPEALVVGDRAVDRVGRLPAFHITLPLPAESARLVSVEAVPGALVVHARVDQWRVRMTPKSVDDLVRRLSSAASVLDLSRWSRG